MRYCLGIVLLTSLSSTAHAQLTTVTGTVADPNNVPYSSASIKMQLVAAAGSPVSGQPTLTINNQQQCVSGGFGSAPCQVPFQGTVGPFQLSAGGSFTTNLQDNTQVTPAGTQWLFTISLSPGEPSPLGFGPQSCSAQITISGASQSVSVALSAACPALTRLGTVTGVAAGSVSWTNVTPGANTQVGTYSQTGATMDFSGSVLFRHPVSAGAAPTSDGSVASNSTTHSFNFGSNGTTVNVAAASTGAGGTGTTCAANTAVTALSTTAAPTCAAVPAAWVTLLPGTNTSAGTFAQQNGTMDFSASAAFKNPVAAGGAPTADGALATNSTTHTLNFGSNGATVNAAAASTGAAGTGTTCSAASAVTAISTTAAPTCTALVGSGTAGVGIVSQQFTTLSVNVSVGNTTTTVTSLSVTMPASGCPCRVRIDYGLYLAFPNTNVTAWAFWVNDGTAGTTHTLASLQTDQSNGSTGARTSANAGAWTQLTYANSANVTFTLFGQGTGATTMNVEAAPQVGSGTNSWMQAIVQTSN